MKTNLMIPYQLMSQLRVHAELHGTGSAEASGTIIIAEALAREPAIADKAERRAKAVKEADKAWREAWPSLAGNEELP